MNKGISLDFKFRCKTRIIGLCSKPKHYCFLTIRRVYHQFFFKTRHYLNPPGTKGFGTHTKHQGGGGVEKDPPVSQEREMLQT